MFENLSERLERSFKILKGEGKITEINVAETVKDIRKALLDASSVLLYPVRENSVSSITKALILSLLVSGSIVLATLLEREDVKRSQLGLLSFWNR